MATLFLIICLIKHFTKKRFALAESCSSFLVFWWCCFSHSNSSSSVLYVGTKSSLGGHWCPKKTYRSISAIYTVSVIVCPDVFVLIVCNSCLLPSTFFCVLVHVPTASCVCVCHVTAGQPIRKTPTFSGRTAAQ